jgi:hypothetical protein
MTTAVQITKKEAATVMQLLQVNLQAAGMGGYDEPTWGLMAEMKELYDKMKAAQDELSGDSSD